MDKLQELNGIALARGYDSREEMLELSKLDPDTIHDEDPRTWPDHKVVGDVITIKRLAGGSFRVEDGPRYNEGLTFDEMLGVIASLTMPERRPCLQWMQTKEQHDAYEAHLIQLREKRKLETTPTT